MLLEAWPRSHGTFSAVIDTSSTLPSAEHIFHRHVPQLYSLAWHMTGNEADAEDVVGDVLLQVVRKLEAFRGESELSTWLHRVTVNAALAQRGKRGRRREVASVLGAPGEEAALHRAGPAREGPEQRALRREALRLVEQAVAGLPPQYRDVYVLADLEQLPNAEIGEVLGLSPAAVKSRLHRARLRIRKALAFYG